MTKVILDKSFEAYRSWILSKCKKTCVVGASPVLNMLKMPLLKALVA